MKRAFTMAEILLSLTIIGVVAAITLPSLTGNINERTWNTQRKALYARFSQALALMPNLNGYGTLVEDESGSVTEDTVAETFITAGLSKVLKINNICEHEHLADCGIANNITTFAGSKITTPKTMQELNSSLVGSYSFDFVADGIRRSASMSVLNTKAAAFETNNGESIVVYYNPGCTDLVNTGDSHYAQAKMCANFVYDLNGKKGPNTVGKDIGFISVLYPNNPVIVAPLPLSIKPIPGGSIGFYPGACTKLGAKMPNREEASALFFNRDLIGANTGSGFWWTSSTVSQYPNRAWVMVIDLGWIDHYPKSGGETIHCIKR